VKTVLPDELRQNAPPLGLGQLEIRSIDYVPPAERHGRVRDQFSLWFALNANLFAVVIGGVLIFINLSFVWACVAIVLGTLLGLAFVGLHAIQGPRLGVPQMIQSRGQFGFYGAVIVFVASIVLNFGFLAAQLVIQAVALNLFYRSIGIPVWIVLLAIPVVVLTIMGYDWIHRWQRWMTVVLGITFVALFIQTIRFGHGRAVAGGTHAPTFALFMGAVGIFVIGVISWAPFVSDYSRYLPETVNRTKTIFCGILGAYITALLPHASSTVSAIRDVAGTWILPVMAVSLIGSDAANAYTGMHSLASIASCFTDVRGSIKVRVVGSLVLIAAGTGSALLGYKDFVNNLTNFLDVLLFVFIPWTAINLTDYYFIKRGNYDVPSFFTPRGVYGGYLWRGLIAYGLAVAIEVPFIDQTFYTGPLVKPLGGIDISWVIGGVAGAVFYLIAMHVSSRAEAGGEKRPLRMEPEISVPR
jgi:NCS1 family nucleobase:cation symporter-1